MKIALMMENSQSGKNAIVLGELEDVVEPLGHHVFNVGMCDEKDHHLTYIHLGIQASILLNSKSYLLKYHDIEQTINVYSFIIIKEM